VTTVADDEPNLLVARDGPVARVTMNRPRLHNAFDEALIEALTLAFEGLADDPAVRVVVLTGAGKSFSAGADLNWMRRAAAYDEERNRADARALEAMLRTLDELPKPAVAMVNGLAIGGGVGLVAACDVAVASGAAAFATSEVRFGILPAVISPFVVRAVGGRQARRYFLTAERFGAEEARRIGLVHEVAAPEALEARVGEVVAELLRGGPEALGEAKRLVRLVEATPQGGSLLAEATVGMIAERRASAEGREGVGAFLEKRRPSWLAGGGDP
jgi:methylglutaconyl-CoA hydratase